MCLSCHDGTIANSNFGDVGEKFPTATKPDVDHQITNSTATDLSNDHPLNFAYPDPATTGFTGVFSTVADLQTAGLVLFGTTETVQCGTCHDPHDNTHDKYLRIANTGGTALCTTCHL
jgi:predicted CXXCH cytochrome family protein